MIDARQRGIVARRIFLSLNGARLRVGAPAVTFVTLDRLVLAVLLVALRQVDAHHRLTAEFLFDFLEASSAVGFALGGMAASAGDFDAGGGVDAPPVAGGRVELFGFVVAFFGATGRVETGHALATTGFQDLGIARALFGQKAVHAESNLNGGSAARLLAFLTGSQSSAGDLVTGVSVDAPALTGGTVALSGLEETIFVTNWNKVTDGSGWTQSFGTFNVADRALRLASSEGGAAIDLFTGVGIYAPASSSRAVALGGFEEAKFRASWNKFAGHGLASILSCFFARTNGFSALCGD